MSEVTVQENRQILCNQAALESVCKHYSPTKTARTNMHRFP